MYFRILDDLTLEGRWYLTAPRPRSSELAPSTFTTGQPFVVTEPLHARWRRSGTPLDFTLADFDVPIVSRRAAYVLGQHAPADVDFLPVELDGAENYFVMNVLTRLDCISEELSEFLKWEAKDGRPEKLGEFRMVTRLRIDPRNIPATLHVFRLCRWQVPIVVSERIRDSFIRAGLVGASFCPV